MKYTHIKYIEIVSSIKIVKTISPFMEIDRQKWGTFGILKLIDNGVVYICTCKVT